ncbi:MAG TPA: toll/interleukin-1 receptor domain-containing protein [Eudoraea sp.]|nr:toll/interleukin-1 receptor domain-containing protein [Eudoraea sp.]
MKTIRSTKKRLLILLLAGFVLLFIMLLLQTVSDKYAGKVWVPWLWFSLLYLPPLIILYQLRSSTKKIRSTGLVLLTVLFAGATLMVILLQGQGLISIPEGQLAYEIRVRMLWISLIFLLPLELFLIFLFRKNLHLPDKNDQEGIPIIMDPKVFISYNHSNSEIAKKIQQALENAEIEVIIDQEDMRAGDDIKAFIEKSIRESTVTVSLVSNESLTSAWVAMETVDTFFQERYSRRKKFIACYLDDDFFQTGYTLKAIDEIDKQIKANQDLIPEYHKKMLDTRDLNSQNSRLLALRSNLDGIVGKLRDSLCLDVREATFEASMGQLVAAVEDGE